MLDVPRISVDDGISRSRQLMQGLRVPDLGMEARMEEESRTSSQHLFVTVEGTPASHSCNNIKEWEMDALQQVRALHC